MSMAIWIRRGEDERRGEIYEMATRQDTKVVRGQSRLETTGKVIDNVRAAHGPSSRYIA